MKEQIPIYNDPDYPTCTSLGSLRAAETGQTSQTSENPLYQDLTFVGRG